MRCSRVTLLAFVGLVLGLVSALPVQQSEGLLPESQALDRLVMVEADDEAALRSKRTIGVLRTLFPDISADVNPEAENQVAAASQNNAVRVQFADDQAGNAANEATQPELAPLDDIEVADENRNKRFLFGSLGGGGGSGSGGGSGNFLFDIIRQTADGAARAAGTVYRVVAGTQSLGLGLSASRDISPIPPAAPAAMAPMVPMAPMAPMAPAMPMPMPMGKGMGMGMVAPPAPPAPAAPGAPASPPGNATAGPGLVAGSGSTEQGDAAANAPVDPGRGAGDGIQEAVPGPITRLFVIANRGISNLVQDLILRLAATSERIVNFKARLITSII